VAPASAQALPGSCLPVEEEEDKGNFLKNPMLFWDFSGKAKTGLKTIDFVIWKSFWSSKITLDFM
jgi:hypothetical protein